VLAALWRLQYQVRQFLGGLRCRYRDRGRAPRECPRPQRVLLVIAGLVGDSVMSSPVILEARRLWPEAELALIGTPLTCGLFAACPYIDEFHEALALPYTIRHRRHVDAIRAWLRERRFDVAFIVLGDQFAPLLARSGVPIRVGVRGTTSEGCLTHTYDLGDARTWGPRERLRCLEALGAAVRDTPPRLWVLPDARSSAAQRLLSLGISAGEPYIVVHPFGRTERQWWPIDRVPDLARRATELGYKTVLVGGEETRSAGVTALRLWAADARGLLGMQDLVAVVERASVVVTTDSGPFHLAGALGIKTVGLFRASRPEHANRYPQATVLQGHDTACDGRCSWERCAWLPCRQMAALSVGQVARTLQQVLADRPS
jgi:ADP-heptose:LPS heptosyltransferase